MKKLLITGANGQIGSELTLAFRKIYGHENVVATDLNPVLRAEIKDNGPTDQLDVLDRKKLESLIDQYQIDAIVHLAAILSAVGEKNSQMAWNVNMNGTINVLEVAREKGIKRIFIPSSIAVFGPTTPRDCTPQDTILQPSTMYGVTKVAGELLGDYYVQKFGMDIRGLRYPGIISHETLPGGGTTDYAVAIFYDAVKHGKYECFLKEDTKLPMMYMPDCLKATTDLFQADFSKLRHHAGFNVGAFSITPQALAESIQKVMPNFEITYKPDFRQAIADSWPNCIDDSAAREEWGWKPQYDLDAMTEEMLRVISEKHRQGLI
ncbi:MAG: NAD-dependent epimerase/dehydratase family protein [Bacteroidales bacterium]|nr:NAD-dependent epimerase/dehydratase family protein [Bacteroidales bacterium]